jgi:tetratricopeptide (TPR) repeat protein
LGPDQENVRLALEWSLERGDVDASLRLGAILRGYWSLLEKPIQGAAVLERCLALAGGTPSPAAVHVMSILGFLYLQQGETARAEAHLERAIAVARSNDDGEGGAVAGGTLGMAALQRGELGRAEQLLETAARQLKTTRPEGSGFFRFNLSWVALARGDAGQAVKELEVVLAEGEAMGSEGLVVHALAALAPMLALAGDPGRAEALAAQGIEAARRLEVRRVLVMALIRAAQVATLVGTPERAGRCLAEALVILRGMAGNAWVADAVEMTALTLGAQGRHRPAARLLGACDARRELSGEVAEGGAIHPLRLRYQEEAESVLGPAQFEEERRRGAALTRDEMVWEALTEISREAA